MCIVATPLPLPIITHNYSSVDPTFTTWIFQRAAGIAHGPASTIPEIKTEVLGEMMAVAQPEASLAYKAEPEDIGMDAMDTSTSGLSRPNRAAGNAGPRLLSHALAPLGNQPIRTHMSQGVKRGFSPDAAGSEDSKRRSLGNSRHAPSGPRAMRDDHGADDMEDRDSRMNPSNGAGKSLLDRLGGPPLNHHAPEFHVGAGGARGRGGFVRGRGGHMPNGSKSPVSKVRGALLIPSCFQTSDLSCTEVHPMEALASSLRLSLADRKRSRCRV